MISRVYIDTSVVGGCLDDEFATWSELLFNEFRSGTNIAVVSDLMLQELEDASKEGRLILSESSPEFVENVFLTDEVIAFADDYIAQGVVNEKTPY